MSSSISIELDKLIVGRTPTRPICTESGELIFTANSPVTEEAKSALMAQDVTEVVINEEDYAELVDPDRPEKEPEQPVESATDEAGFNLAELAGTGMLAVENDGPPFSASMTRHGASPYSADAIDAVCRTHEQSAYQLHSMMATVLGGRSIGAKPIAAIADRYLALIKDDIDLVLHSLVTWPTQGIAQQSLRLSVLGMAIGAEIGLDEDNLRLVGQTGLVQDWGMARVPKHVRELCRAMTAVEFLEVQKHPSHTIDMLKSVNDLPHSVRLVAFQVHERPDGTGYPRGRHADKIHLFARILHVAEAYAALNAPKPHRPALMGYAAMECLIRQAQRSQVDTSVVRALLHVTGLFPVGTHVQLTDKGRAIVLRGNGPVYTDPVVYRLDDPASADYRAPGQVVDLEGAGLSITAAFAIPGRRETGLTSEILVPRRSHALPIGA